MKLLKQLCELRASSGDEVCVRDFLINYVEKHSNDWASKPTLYYGDEFQDSLVLVFGKPRTAIFAHMDSIGFTVAYENELVKIGGPRVKHGYRLVGSDSQGEIECGLVVEDSGELFAHFPRIIDRGTPLTFKPDFRETSTSVQCCYMDNRLGVYAALNVAETLSDGIICFSTYEEHGGGSANFLAHFIYSKFQVRQALISDITWITDGVKAGRGVAISMRDSYIPRRQFLQRIIRLAHESKVPFQLEVESAGGSDGAELQKGPYPIDWCFIGAAEKHVHTPDEWVNKKDIKSMIALYVFLMKEL